MNDLGELIRRRIVAVVCHVRLEHLDTLLAALTAGGVSAVEFTFTGEEPTPASQQARTSHPEVIFGAGTIRTVAQLGAGVAAGARFGVSSHLDPDLVRAARSRAFAYIPGVLSPSELASALALGCEAVKVFPIGVHGLGYVGDLLTLFPEAALMVSGGVGVAAAQQYLEAGAWIVGLGGALVGSGGSAPDPELITRRASEATQPTRETRIVGL
jgi:2-dehydro-3-deoxyphosphogluconate aldolase / (4S)-4-hydroxy-2-oxoglutarate aldolase